MEVFSDAELAAIREATREAELRTSAEIVVYVVERCDRYEEPLWRLATFAAVAASAVAFAFLWWVGIWDGRDLGWLALTVPFAAGLAYVTGRWVPTLHRLLIPAAELERRSRSRAEGAFLEEAIFDTRERTGVLIFLGIFERQVVMIEDAGIHAVIEEGTLRALCDRVGAAMKSGDAAREVVAVIGELAGVLVDAGLAVAKDDLNELSDEVRFREE